MGDFLAAPFLLMAYITIWCASLIDGKSYALMSVEYEEEDDEE